VDNDAFEIGFIGDDRSRHGLLQFAGAECRRCCPSGHISVRDEFDRTFLRVAGNPPEHQLRRYNFSSDVSKERMTLRGLLRSALMFAMGYIGLFARGIVLAAGYFFPAEGQGSGDYSLVRSNDAGRHWVELAEAACTRLSLLFPF
jgi:hypothetical protein